MKAILLFLFSLSAYTQDRNCLNQTSENGEFWARKLGRGQTGRYFQYTAKSIARTQSEGWLLSKGYALTLLKEECGTLPNGIKVFEQCQEKKKEAYYTYSRYSILKKSCGNKKLKNNDELVKLLTEFKKYKKKLDQQKLLECIESKTSCIKESLVLFELAEDDKAITLLQNSCSNGIKNDCFFLASHFQQQKNSEKRILFLKKACMKIHKEACMDLYNAFRNKEISNLDGLETPLCKSGIKKFCPKTPTSEEEIEVLDDSIQSFEI